MAGQGWRMLVECLSCGRAISLPSSAAGAIKCLAALTGAYARIRRQFKHPIGHLWRVQKALARIAGNAYICEAARIMTAGSIDLGESPSVLCYHPIHLTERGRQISMMPSTFMVESHHDGTRNVISTHYINAPVTITVEGRISDSQYDYFWSGRHPVHSYRGNLTWKILALRTWAIDPIFRTTFPFLQMRKGILDGESLKFEGQLSQKRSRVVAVHLLLLLIFPY